MKHISLFSGIGGFDLAAEWMGWENIAHCEWNPFGQRVLKYYWPNAISYHDITKTDFTIHRGTIDLLTGGFPCQPYSVAGKRKGKDDERHLWPEMLRAIREIQPRWVVGENVGGLISWNGGMVFDEVQADLEAEGYEILPFLLPAAGVNAPHKRDRIWFIAYAHDNGRSSEFGEVPKENGEISEWNKDAEPCNTGVARAIKDTYSDGCKCHVREKEPKTGRQWNISTGINEQLSSNNGEIKSSSNASSERCNNGGDNRKERHLQDDIDGDAEEDKSEGYGWKCGACEVGSTIANTDNKPLQRREASGITESCGQKTIQQFVRYGEPCGWTNFPTQSPVRYGDDGFSERLDGITFSKWRNESIKAGGNAIVPQVALQIFKAIEQYENQQP